MDALLHEVTGGTIIQSTGNYHDERMHAAGQVLPGHQRTLTWRTDKADFTPNELEVWYSGCDSLTVEVNPPGSDAVFRAAFSEQHTIQIGGQEVGRIYHRARDPSSGDNHIDIFLDPA